MRTEIKIRDLLLEVVALTGEQLALLKSKTAESGVEVEQILLDHEAGCDVSERIGINREHRDYIMKQAQIYSSLLDDIGRFFNKCDGDEVQKTPTNPKIIPFRRKET